jgi:hypothetical protein
MKIEKPKLWRHMTDEEKGALLLAYVNGKTIESYEEGVACGWYSVTYPSWSAGAAYRVKPEPVRETFTHTQWVSMHTESSRGAFSLLYGPCSRHATKGQTTIDTVDGKPVRIVWEADSE